LLAIVTEGTDMGTSPIVSRALREGWSDEDVIKRVLDGETGAYEIIMRRYNQRLYRVAMSILKDEAESEDVTQESTRADGAGFGISAHRPPKWAATSWRRCWLS